MTTRTVRSFFALAAALACLSLGQTLGAAQRGQGAGGQASAGGQGRGGGRGAGTPAGCPEDPAHFRPCALEKAKTFEPPRTADGKPDFQGFWASGIQAFNIEEHTETFDYRGEPSLIVDPPDGTFPYQLWALAIRNDRAVHHADPPTLAYVDPNAQCFLRGVPRQMWINQFQISQPAGAVLLLFEQNHAYRVIPTDGRPHLPKGIGLWMQDSRGIWDGNTLVVDVTNPNGRTWLDNQGNFYSEHAHVVEHLRLVDIDTLLYEATIDDPTVFTKPWTMAYSIRRSRDPDNYIMEFACTEGNVSIKMQLTRPGR